MSPRGPYEPSLRRFVDCVCYKLEKGEYTYNEVKDVCGVSYRTVGDYATISLNDVNLEIYRECGRSIKPTEVYRAYPGIKVDPPSFALDALDTFTQRENRSPCLFGKNFKENKIDGSFSKVSFLDLEVALLESRDFSRKSNDRFKTRGHVRGLSNAYSILRMKYKSR
jgi:hypothetical protein